MGLRHLRPIGAAVALVFGLCVLGGCASMTVTDTTPLPAAKLLPPGSEQISRGGYRFASMPLSTDAPDLVVLVAISGGGKRSASFGYGALEGMRNVMVPTASGPRSLLHEVSAISGVSGGSFPAAYYGLYRDAAFGRFEKDFLYSDTESYIWGIYLLPWNWAWLVDPSVGTNDFMEKVYDRTMFHGATFHDLQVRGRPLIVIDATDLSYGTPFLFTQEQFDLICSDLDRFPVARAVAASNGFPGLFSPVTLTNRARDCGGRKPGWLRRVTPAELQNPLSRVGNAAIAVGRYLDPARTRYVHLVDGGVSDNLALRAAGSQMQAIAQSSTAIASHGLDHIRRILVLSIDGQGAQDPTIAQRKAVGGIFSLFGLVSGGQIDRYNFETMTAVTQQLRLLVRAIRQARCAEAPVVAGARCSDVEGQLIQISLRQLPDSREKQSLLAIPTGLTLKRRDVDMLVHAGRAAVENSAALRHFLDDYPARAVPGDGRQLVN